MWPKGVRFAAVLLVAHGILACDRNCQLGETLDEDRCVCETIFQLKYLNLNLTGLCTFLCAFRWNSLLPRCSCVIREQVSVSQLNATLGVEPIKLRGGNATSPVVCGDDFYACPTNYTLVEVERVCKCLLEEQATANATILMRVKGHVDAD